MFDKRPADDINNSVNNSDTFSIKFTKSNTKFCLSLHYNCDSSTFYLNKTDICDLNTSIVQNYTIFI